MTELSQAQSAAANAIDVATAKLLSTHDAHFQQVVQSQESILKQLELLSSGANTVLHCCNVYTLPCVFMVAPQGAGG